MGNLIKFILPLLLTILISCLIISLSCCYSSTDRFNGCPFNSSNWIKVDSTNRYVGIEDNRYCQVNSLIKILSEDTIHKENVIKILGPSENISLHPIGKYRLLKGKEINQPEQHSFLVYYIGIEHFCRIIFFFNESDSYIGYAILEQSPTMDDF